MAHNPGFEPRRYLISKYQLYAAFTAGLNPFSPVVDIRKGAFTSAPQ
jgi:hypothetical protein